MRTPTDPNWARLGFSEPPDFKAAGKDIGIVIIDRITPHPAIQHLRSRLKYITVHDDNSITCRDIANEDPEENHNGDGEHGLMTVLALSHLPFVHNGQIHTGIAPAANLVVLDHGAFKAGEGERLRAGISWIMQKRKEWNIRIILSTGWHALDHQILLKSTKENTTVQALASAVQAGILVVCSNGNTRTINILPPFEYLAVGGYNDRGLADHREHRAFPDEPYGRNADGHFRPDVLAPRVFLTLPFCESHEEGDGVSYYWGTSGASALVTGVAAYLLSKYTSLDVNTLRHALTTYGDPLHGYENPAPRINVHKVEAAIVAGVKINDSRKKLPSLYIRDASASLQSQDEMERAVALSTVVRNQHCSRELLWQYLDDPSPVVRKIAVSGLDKPLNEQERDVFWERLEKESEGGVRGLLASGLLQDVRKNEVAKWIPWSTDINWSVRWCVSEYLANFPDAYPQLIMTHDPDSIISKAAPLIQWLIEKQS